MVVESLQGLLHNLQTTYIAALILHSPYKAMDDILTEWRTIKFLVDNGMELIIGISNYYKYETLSKLYDSARIKPTILQNHFKTVNFKQFTRDNSMDYQAFWSLTANKHCLQKKSVQ